MEERLHGLAPTAFPSLLNEPGSLAPVDDAALGFAADDLAVWLEQARTGGTGVPAATNPAAAMGVAITLPDKGDKDEHAKTSAAANPTAGAALFLRAHMSLPMSAGVSPSNLAAADSVASSQATPAGSPTVTTAGSPLLLEPSVLAQLAEFAAQNDPAWVTLCQQAALKGCLWHLDAAAQAGKEVPAAPSHVRALDALPAMAQLKRHPPRLPHGARAPKLSTSQLHFLHTISAKDDAAAGGDDADEYFSAQVKITNDGRQPFSVKMVQLQQFGVDEGSTAAVDFHANADRSVAQKGEAVTILLSLIVRPEAVFSAMTHLIVLVVDDAVRIFVSMTVVNPYGPVFAVPVPQACTTVVTTPLGTYRVPAALATFRGVFAARNGFSTAVGAPLVSPQTGGHLVDTEAHGLSWYAGLKATLDDAGHPPLLRDVSGSYLPPSLALLAPDQVQALALLWLCEYPLPLLPPSIMASADPLGYLQSELPSESHGIVLWVVDHVCEVVAGSPNVCRGSLVLTFAHALASSSLAVLAGGSGKGGFEAGLEMARACVWQLSVWVNAFLPRYVKAAKKK